MFIRAQRRKFGTTLAVVHSERDGDRVRQRNVLYLGRLRCYSEMYDDPLFGWSFKGHVAALAELDVTADEKKRLLDQLVAHYREGGCRGITQKMLRGIRQRHREKEAKRVQ